MSPLLAACALFTMSVGALADAPRTQSAPDVPRDEQHAAIQSPSTQPVSYMGIATAILPPVLREHLGLQPGMGLLVDHVDPGSPADRAGMKANDILLRLEDQLLISVYQLTVLVRARQVGEVITLHVMRQGKPMPLQVTLGGKELPPVETPSGLILPQDMPDTPFPRVGQGRVSRVVTHVDDEHSISITTHDERKHITVKDRTGAVIYDGELTTPEDHRRIPDGLREKVEMVERGADRVRDLRPPPRAQPDRGAAGSM
ncbi:MAG: PDZ domain-containing protein [Burkholderiales bacterium]|nr:PDZ domain-containing protein [Phycisphaerae bacterium]